MRFVKLLVQLNSGINYKWEILNSMKTPILKDFFPETKTLTGLIKKCLTCICKIIKLKRISDRFQPNLTIKK